MEAKERIGKRRHPLENVNILSRIFFCWGLPLFSKGYRKDLEDDDLYLAVKEHQSNLLGNKLERAWNEEKVKKNASLWRPLFRVFGQEFALYGVALFVLEILVRMCHPLVLQKVISYYEPYQTAITKNEAFLYSTIIMLISLTNVLSGHLYVFGLQTLGMKMRIACCSLIYRKALKLNKSAFAETSVGQMVNLLSNDVNRFDQGLLAIHNIWVGPLEIFVIVYLLYINLGLTSLSGISILIFFVPLQLYMGKRSGVFRLKTALKTDQRIRLMNEIIAGVQVIKMYTWEKPFAKLVAKARKLEIIQIKRASFVRAINVSFLMYLNRTSIYLCVLAYVLTGNTLRAQYVYVATSFYGVLQSVILFLPQAATSIAETNVSVKRIQKFLMYDEVEGGIVQKAANGIQLMDAYAKWTDNWVLKAVSFEAGRDQLVAVIGSVGGGKTTLLHVILKELALDQGALEVSGTISYSSQEPWLFSGSIKQNILFGELMDEKRYMEVVRVCALEADFSNLPYGDKTLVGERGVMLSGGQKARINLARAVYKDADIYLLDDPLSAVDANVGKQLFDNCISSYLQGKCRILVTHQLQYLKSTDKLYVLEDGIMTKQDFEYVRLLKKEEVKEVDEVLTKQGLEEEKEQRSVGTVNRRVYGSYLRAGGPYVCSILVLVFFALAQLGATATDYFQTYWVNLEQDREFNQTTYSLTPNNYLYIYSGLIAFTIVITLTRSIWFFMFCLKASKNLHDEMFSRIIHATMRFFNTNSSGRILNRFSKDMGAIDDLLPGTLTDTIQIAMTVLATALVVCFVNAWILIPTAVIFIVFYIYRRFFVATSRDLKRMEGTSRSPVFAHLTASLQGLTTIRAYGAQELLKNQFDWHQDVHTSAFFTYIGGSRSFGFWLDLHCVVYIGIVTLSFLFIGNEKYGGSVGLAITQSISLTGILQWGIRQWSELENQMTSVERIVEYTEMTPEPSGGQQEPPKDWPNGGAISFESVSLQYSPSDPLVLQNLTFQVKPNEKIGIVGRTGAGKSSLISALFRLVETQGEIIIDGVNTKTLTLENLRSKISIIPQDPVLFSGTLRKNLDPFDEYDDSVLWSALEDVELKAQIGDLGLHCRVSDGGSNFSVGQRQLLCLARAVIRRNKILVLDEATANVDLKTDELIQKTIRKKFVDCTVLTIAHRLHTIMDSDRVLVMDRGKVVEFDQPFALMEEKGVFYSLVLQTGQEMANNLLKMSKKNS